MLHRLREGIRPTIKSVISAFPLEANRLSAGTEMTSGDRIEFCNGLLRPFVKVSF